MLWAAGPQGLATDHLCFSVLPAPSICATIDMPTSPPVKQGMPTLVPPALLHSGTLTTRTTHQQPPSLHCPEEPPPPPPHLSIIPESGAGQPLLCPSSPQGEGAPPTCLRTAAVDCNTHTFRLWVPHGQGLCYLSWLHLFY